MKLYKFRSLATCEDLVRAQRILETGEFWCSRFWELNDPMEGVYWFHAGTLTREIIRDIYGEKANYALCSFSAKRAFANPILWGYYANGFKGVAIEIEVDRKQEESVTRVRYSEDVPQIEHGHGVEAAKQILTTKLKCWSHENEYRYIAQHEHRSHQIGRITAVYFGIPYRTTVNAEDALQRPRVREYLCRVRSLQRTAARQARRCIPCYLVDVENGRVVIKERCTDLEG